MATARVFKSGNSQAIRLPKEFQVKEKELEITRRGDKLILQPKKQEKNIARAFHLIAALPDDVFTDLGRDDPPQEREGL